MPEAFKWVVAPRYRVTATSVHQDGSASSVYYPLQIPGLHREFGSLVTDDFQGFASDFGLLGLGGETERLRDWEGECGGCKKAVAYVDALWGRQWPGWQEDVIPHRVFATFDLDRRLSQQSKVWVVGALQELLSRKLKKYTAPGCAAHGTTLETALEPLNLLGAIWLLVAKAAAGEQDEVECMRCSNPIEVGRALGGRRMNTKFCSDTCRVGGYQARSRQADRLLDAGIPPARVAYRSGLSPRAMQRRLRRRK